MQGEEGVFGGLHGHDRLAVALEGAEFVRAEVVLFVIVEPSGEVTCKVVFREVGGGFGRFSFGVRRDRVTEGDAVVVGADDDGDAVERCTGAGEFDGGFPIAVRDDGAFSPQWFPGGINAAGLGVRNLPTACRGFASGAEIEAEGRVGNERSALPFQRVAEGSRIALQTDDQPAIRAGDFDRRGGGILRAVDGEDGHGRKPHETATGTGFTKGWFDGAGFDQKGHGCGFGISESGFG